jgi:hypothetical protein
MTVRTRPDVAYMLSCMLLHRRFSSESTATRHVTVHSHGSRPFSGRGASLPLETDALTLAWTSCQMSSSSTHGNLARIRAQIRGLYSSRLTSKSCCSAVKRGIGFSVERRVATIGILWMKDIPRDNARAPRACPSHILSLASGLTTRSASNSLQFRLLVISRNIHFVFSLRYTFGSISILF